MLSEIITLEVPIFLILFQNFTRSSFMMPWLMISYASYSIHGIYCHQISQNFLSAKFLAIQANGYTQICMYNFNIHSLHMTEELYFENEMFLCKIRVLYMPLDLK